MANKGAFFSSSSTLRTEGTTDTPGLTQPKTAMDDHRARTSDPFLLNYNATDLRIASEFLGNWLPFLSRGLCRRCTLTLSDSVRSLRPVEDTDGDMKPLSQKDNFTVSDPYKVDVNGINENQDNCNTNSVGSCKDGDMNDPNDTADKNSLGSRKDGDNGWSEPTAEASTSETIGSQTPTETPRLRMSWADMAQEDELEAEEDNEVNSQVGNVSATSGEAPIVDKDMPKMELSRERREYIRFSNVERKKDFICLERLQGKITNVLDGLELHAGVFSAVEQKRIVDFVYDLQEMGKKGQLKERTYTAPRKWKPGKGRVTIQFGCCYNYATDKNGNPPGILKNEDVDPIPHLFKVIIRRLVGWHVLPPSCVPDSCIVNIYDEGDCIPPHIDNHDFVRPFCTVSFLSECNILFGTNLKILDAGEFSGPVAIPLPVGSVLVLNGNGADVAKHCVPAVPTKRISITFRKMDESKWPIGFVPEPDLQGLQPLSYKDDKSKQLNPSRPRRPVNRQVIRGEDYREEERGLTYRGNSHLDPPYSLQVQKGPGNRRRVRVNFDS